MSPTMSTDATTSAAPTADEATEPAWTPTGSLQEARTGHTATLLPDGRVLVAGGNGAIHATDNLGFRYLDSAEVYDPATGLWTATGRMTTARSAHMATLLPNGMVLVEGGANDVSGTAFPLASAELFDPATGLWTPTGNMAEVRWDHTATLLPNGTVLVTSFSAGTEPASAEIYDPRSGSWAVTGYLVNGLRYSPTATLLPDETVLVAGGLSPQGYPSPTASAERYYWGSASWAVSGEMITGERLRHTATLLPDGTVLVAGGEGGGGLSAGDRLASAEVYDHRGDAWTATGSLGTDRQSHKAVRLPNGSVLVMGGDGDGGDVLTSAELYDPDSGSWTFTLSMIDARYGHTATLLPDGTVLVVGGINISGVLAAAELYDPG